jgi:hypothetical protein
MTMSELSDVAQRFAILKAAKEQKEREVQLINTELSVLGAKLFELLADSGVATLRLDGKNLFVDKQDRILSPDTAYKTSIVDQPKFFGLLRTGDEGSLIKETIHPATLEKWIRGLVEMNKPFPDETVLKVWTVNGAKVRRAPKSA